MSTIHAATYSIAIGEQTPQELNAWLEEHSHPDHRFVLVDENTHSECLERLENAGVPALSTAHILEIESGEAQKNLDICTQLWLTLTEAKADRSSVMINLGGGVIGDMGGFVAACYQRGMPFVQVPTTLLAMVDASVGSKVGVDLEGLKNQIGAFADPAGVFIWPAFLDSLAPRQLISGWAEVLKHALLDNTERWNSLSQRDPASLTSSEWAEILHWSVGFKNNIVAADKLETGPRRLLNFGHTIGHALETYAMHRPDLSLLHGEAVALGIVAESWLSVQEAGLSAADFESVKKGIENTFPAFSLDAEGVEQVLALTRHDKKNRQGKYQFTLLESIGKGRHGVTVGEELVLAALEHIVLKTST